MVRNFPEINLVLSDVMMEGASGYDLLVRCERRAAGSGQGHHNYSPNERAVCAGSGRDLWAGRLQAGLCQ